MPDHSRWSLAVGARGWAPCGPTHFPPADVAAELLVGELDRLRCTAAQALCLRNAVGDGGACEPSSTRSEQPAILSGGAPVITAKVAAEIGGTLDRITLS